MDNKKVNIALYLVGKDHTVDKYNQILILFDELINDNRFNAYIMIDDRFYDKLKPITKKYGDRLLRLNYKQVCNADRFLDEVIIINPYAIPRIPYRDWSSKIIYKEYGTSGIDASYDVLYKKSIYKQADLIITDNEFTKSEISKKVNSDKVIIGSPAYDYPYYTNYDLTDDGYYHIIWSPHHSIIHEDSYNCVFGDKYYSSFLSNMNDIPKIIELNDKIILHVKYHPTLPKRYDKYCRANKIDDNFEKYLNRITNDRVIIEGSEYYNLFEKSSGMINDSISFIQEYLPTKKPMMIIQNSQDDNYSSYGNQLIDDCYYRAYSIDDINKFVVDKIINGNDYKKSMRNEYLKKYYISSSSSNSKKLLDVLYNL